MPLEMNKLEVEEGYLDNVSKSGFSQGGNGVND